MSRSNGYQVMLTPSFTSCVTDMANRNPPAAAAVWETVRALERQPFHNPTLQTHAMQGAREKLFISYVGGPKGQRLIWTIRGRTIVLLLFGEHDIEDRAVRLRLVDDPTGDAVRIEYHEVVETAAPTPAVSAPPARVGRLFMPWTEEELRAYGFEPHEIEALRQLDHPEEIEQLNLRPEAEERALSLALYHQPEAPPERIAVAEQVLAAERATEQRITSPRSREHFVPYDPALMEEILSRPIEDWMIFLHPDQAALTQRPFSGPARVRGPAGTGKTVVALHRAAHLARTYGGPVLFTTYIRNLPRVWEELFRRLAPDLADRVEFRTLHSWAARFLRQRGIDVAVEPQRVERALAAAWQAEDEARGLLSALGITRRYVADEIAWVIKGRNVRFLDDYLALQRTGRGTPLSPRAREAVWAIFQRYQRELRRSRTADFADLLIRAYEELAAGTFQTPYTGVIVDEVQDLTEVGLRIVYELAGRDARDGLLLVGDGQQSVYPGGVSLKAVGIDVRGRSAVLRVNYRNTAQVFRLAERVVADRPFDDADDELEPGRREVELVREGPEPALYAAADPEEHDLELVAAIERAADQPGVSPGDLAVLVPTNQRVREVEAAIRTLGYTTQRLERYEGVPTPHVKVGTYQRAKGLEFKYVFLPRLDVDSTGELPRPGEEEEAHRERVELLRRQLFVAMTRARDGLWIGWVGRPSTLLPEDIVGRASAPQGR